MESMVIHWDQHPSKRLSTRPPHLFHRSNKPRRPRRHQTPRVTEAAAKPMGRNGMVVLNGATASLLMIQRFFWNSWDVLACQRPFVFMATRTRVRSPDWKCWCDIYLRPFSFTKFNTHHQLTRPKFMLVTTIVP